MTNPVIDLNGTKKWFNSKGRLHREDGPAFEGVNGSICWWINGLRHRDNGPACKYTISDRHRTILHEWWINGISDEVNQ